jgi:hypothetical protein
MNYTIECEQEVDGRWLAEVIELPGVLTYGATASSQSALSRVKPTQPAFTLPSPQRHESMAF